MQKEELNELLTKAKELLKNEVTKISYETWIRDLDIDSAENGNIVLVANNAFQKESIISRYHDLFRNTFNYITNKNCEISVILKDDVTEDKNVVLNQPNTNSSYPNSTLNPKYTFDTFVVGNNNRFAHAAALAVAEAPATAYNPLFIYGGVGLGKTHLMHAIANEILINNRNANILYVTSEKFTNQLINAIKDNKNEMFRNKYRNIDVLLIDDIQFLESKTYTMEEIFHTFDSLHNKNKQIVITSDRLPKDIPTLPDRLRTRFEMGLMVDITPPDFETRVAILANLAEQAGVNAGFEVFEYIAKNFVNNVRELEGAFNKVSAYADIEKTDITLEFTKKVLNCEQIREELTIEKVARAVGDYYGVSIKDFLSSARNQRVSSARHVAVYMARELTEKSFESIAEFFKKKHTTMLYSYEKIKGELRTNKELENSVYEIRRSIEG